MFHRLGVFVSRYWLLVILAWVAVVVTLKLTAPRWNDVTLDGNLEYLPAEMTSVRGQKLLAEAFPNIKAKSQIVVVIERREGRLTKEDDAVIRRLVRALREKLSDLLPLELAKAENSDSEKPASPDAAKSQAAQANRGEEPIIGAIWSPVTLSANDQGAAAIAEQLRSDPNDPAQSGQAALILLHLRTEFMATRNMKILDRVLSILHDFESSETFPGDRLDLGVAGSAAIGSDMLNAAKESIKKTETTTVILVLLILLLVYRAPVLALIPLITIFVSVAVATDVVALLTQASQQVDWFTFKTFKTTKIFLIVILFGAGTDFCLFLIARYREELAAGLERRQAVAQALGHVGVALSASALTTIVGLGMMTFADFGKFRYAGPSLALSLGIALLACVTLAPALLRAAGGVLFWPLGFNAKPQRNGKPATLAGGRMRGFWVALSGRIIAQPGLILVTSFVLLSPLAWYGFAKVETTYDLLSELSDERPSKIGAAMMRRHFPAGNTGPITIVAHHPRADFRSRPGHVNEDQKMIHDLTTYLRTIDGVEDVRSWSAPFGKSLTGSSQAAARRSLAESRFVAPTGNLAGHVAKFQVILNRDPFSPESAERLADIRRQLKQFSRGESPSGAEQFNTVGASLSEAWRDARFEFVGTTAGISDLRDVTTSDRSRIQILCFIAVLAVLLILLRRPVICLYLVCSVLFSYFVAIGTTQLVFSFAYAPHFGGLDWKAPLFLFVILVAIGEDYNIYLATRVFEEQKRLGLIEGLREAIIQTGGIITSCGVIMAGTFISMMSGSLRGMLELGFALALGVMLDTFIVRPILVPAFLALLYRRQERIEALRAAADDPPPIPAGQPHVEQLQTARKV